MGRFSEVCGKVFYSIKEYLFRAYFCLKKVVELFWYVNVNPLKLLKPRCRF